MSCWRARCAVFTMFVTLTVAAGFPMGFFAVCLTAAIAVLHDTDTEDDEWWP